MADKAVTNNVVALKPGPRRKEEPRLKIVQSATDLAAAALELGRLDEAAATSPLQEIWTFREAVRAVSFLISARADTPVSPERLHAALTGLPLTPWPDEGALANAMRLLADAAALWTPSHRGLFSSKGPHLRLWTDFENAADAPPRRSELIRKIRLTKELLEHELDPSRGPVLTELDALWKGYEEGFPFGRLQLMAPMIAFETGLTRTPLPFLAAALPAPEELSKSAWMTRALTRLVEHADAARDRLAGFTRFYRAARDRIGVTPKNSKLLDAFHVSIAAPVATAPLLASVLDCSRQAASGYLRRLEQARILTDVGARDRWRVFIPSDADTARYELRSIGIPFSHVSQPDATAPEAPLAPSPPPPPIDYESLDRKLAELIREADAAGLRAREISKEMAGHMIAADDD